MHVYQGKSRCSNKFIEWHTQIFHFVVHNYVLFILNAPITHIQGVWQLWHARCVSKLYVIVCGALGKRYISVWWVLPAHNGCVSNCQTPYALYQRNLPRSDMTIRCLLHPRSERALSRLLERGSSFFQTGRDGNETFIRADFIDGGAGGAYRWMDNNFIEDPPSWMS